MNDKYKDNEVINEMFEEFKAKRQEEQKAKKEVLDSMLTMIIFGSILYAMGKKRGVPSRVINNYYYVVKRG